MKMKEFGPLGGRVPGAPLGSANGKSSTERISCRINAEAYIIGGFKGAPGMPLLPRGPNSFIFMQFSAKKLKNNSTFGSWRTPSEKFWIRHCK